MCWCFIHYWIEKCTVKQWNSKISLLLQFSQYCFVEFSLNHNNPDSTSVSYCSKFPFNVTFSLTPNYLWSKFLCGKEIGLQLVKNFLSFHWLQSCIKITLHFSLSLAPRIKSGTFHSLSWRSILILYCYHVLRLQR